MRAPGVCPAARGGAADLGALAGGRWRQEVAAVGGQVTEVAMGWRAMHAHLRPSTFGPWPQSSASEPGKDRV